ncbi:MAG: hypothetical protein AB7N71_06090 [Phycisphaerae bacterium]
MFRFTVAVIFCSIFPVFGFAREGPPPSLRQLVLESEIIAFVEVTAVTDWKHRKDVGFPPSSKSKYDHSRQPELSKSALNRLGGDIARLKIKSVIKGEVSKDQELFVYFNSRHICPKPPRYCLSETALVFLRWVPDTGTWVASYGSHGVREMNDEQSRRTWKKAIDALCIVLAERDTERQLQQLTEWYVGCLEDESLRIEAAIDLADQDLRHPIRWPKEEELPGHLREAFHRRRIILALTSEQIRRIENVSSKIEDDSIEKSAMKNLINIIGAVRSENLTRD